MASYTITAAGAESGGKHPTLSSTTADDVTVTSASESVRIEVFNRGTSGGFYVKFGGTVPTAAADGTWYVPYNSSIAPRFGPGVTKVWIVGNGEPYSVHPVTQGVW